MGFFGRLFGRKDGVLGLGGTEAARRLAEAPGIEGSALRQHLKILDQALATRAEMVWVTAVPIQSRASKPDASDNGREHCLRVEQNIWRLISETQHLRGLTATELFLLSCSACCHDLDRGLRTRIPPGTAHGTGSGGFVMEHHEKLGIPRPEAIAIDQVVSIHDSIGGEYLELLADLPQAYPLPTGTVDLQRLAVLLKAADTLHADNTRITEIGTDLAKLGGMDRIKYLFRQCVTGWRCAGNRIVVAAYPDSAEQLEAVFKSESYMKDTEWRAIADALLPYGLPHKLDFENADHLLRCKLTEASAGGLPGMDYYHEGDATLLGGRDSDIASLEQQVLGSQASLLIGPSGVGKSSVLYAGVAPRLSRLDGWRIIVTRPDKLTGAFYTAGDFGDVLDAPVSGQQGFPELCERAMLKCSRLLIVLDQFEDVAYFGAFDAEAISSPVMKALARNRHLKLLFSYRDDVESLMLPLWQAISHTAAGLPKYALRPLDVAGAKASLTRLLLARKLTLEDEESFMKVLLVELAVATARESGIAGESVYPPYIQMVVHRLTDLDDQGVVRRASFDALAEGGHSATDQIVAQFLVQSIKRLPEHGFAEEDGRRVLVCLAHSSGKKGVGDEARLSAETRISADALPGLLAQMATMRLVRRLGSGQWEIAHDVMARTAIATLISEEERRFKQARELLDARSRTFHQYHGHLNLGEMKDLWTKRENLPAAHLAHQERAVILLSMGALEPWDVANATYGYGHDLEDVRGEHADPARWSAPGWYWLSSLDRNTLLDSARTVGKTGDISGATVFLRIASLIGSPEDVASLAELLNGPFSGYSRLAEDTTACIASLATRDTLPLLRKFATHASPYVRKAVAKALGNHGTVDDLALLNKMASDKHPQPGVGGDFNVREAVAEAVGKLGHKEGLAILGRMVDDTDSAVLAEVAAGISKLGAAEGLPLLEKIHSKGGTPAKYAAAKAYAELSTSRDITLLRELVAGKNVLAQEGAVRVLHEFGTAEDLPVIRQMMASPDRGVQDAAVSAIGRMGDRSDLPTLRELATGTDGHWPIRRTAVRAIAAIGEHSDLAFLLKVAATDAVNHLVGRTARRVCWRLATQEDVPMLLSVIGNRNSAEVIQGAITALCALMPDRIVLEQMTEVMLKSSPTVARMAAEASLSRVPAPQLTAFVECHQRGLAPQVLAVYDWHLFAPAFLKESYVRWQEARPKAPPSCW